MTKITRRSFLQVLGAMAGAVVMPKFDISPVPQPPVATKINISQELIDDAGWEPYRTHSVQAEGDMMVIDQKLSIFLNNEWVFFK